MTTPTTERTFGPDDAIRLYEVVHGAFRVLDALANAAEGARDDPARFDDIASTAKRFCADLRAPDGLRMHGVPPVIQDFVFEAQAVVAAIGAMAALHAHELRYHSTGSLSTKYLLDGAYADHLLTVLRRFRARHLRDRYGERWERLTMEYAQDHHPTHTGGQQ